MDEIYNLLEFYYQKNPDSMLPLLMAAAASRDKLEIRPARNPLSWEPQKGIDTELATHIALFSINLDDASAFDWISTDKDFETLIRSGKEQNALSLIVNVNLFHQQIPALKGSLEIRWDSYLQNFKMQSSKDYRNRHLTGLLPLMIF